MSHKRKHRVVQQERLAHRQAVERLRRAYLKLYRQAPSDQIGPVTNPEKTIVTVQEKKE